MNLDPKKNETLKKSYEFKKPDGKSHTYNLSKKIMDVIEVYITECDATPSIVYDSLFTTLLHVLALSSDPRKTFHAILGQMQEMEESKAFDEAVKYLRIKMKVKDG